MLDELAWRAFGVEGARLVPVLLLVLARTLPLAWIAPWLGGTGTSSSARLAVGVVVGLALTPLALRATPALPEGLLPLGLIGVREVLIGAAFGVAVSVPLYALGWAGELLDRWRGSPADATSVGPAGEASPLGALHLGAAVVIFVTLGGHRLALAAFATSFVDVPVGGGADGAPLPFALGAMRIVADALMLALAFAAPAAIAFVVLEIVLGLWGRVAPGLSLYLLGMPLRAGLGVALALVGLSVLLPRLGPVIARSIDAASDLVRTGAT